MSAPSATHAPTPTALLDFAIATAADTGLVANLPLLPDTRTWARIDGPGGAEAWLIGWPPGSSTGWHDHGDATGAFLVVRGTLREYTPARIVRAGRDALALAPGTETQVFMPPHAARSLPPGHVHDVRNNSATEHALSVHVYAPALTMMRKYERAGDRLVLTATERAEDW